MKTDLHFEEVLLEFDEPLVVIGSRNGKKYLCVAISNSMYANPYLCVHINDKQIEKLKYAQIDVKSLIVKPNETKWHIADIYDGSGELKFLTEKYWQLKKEYIPSAGLYVNISHVPSTAIKSKMIHIDGKWSSDDLNVFTKYYNQIYSVIYALIADDSTCGNLASDRHPHYDGFSSMHTYNELFSAIPAFFKPRIQSMKYASPGHLEFVGHTVVNDKFVEILNLISSDYASIVKCYTEAHLEIKSLGLLGKSANEYVEGGDKSIDQILDGHYENIKKCLKLTAFTESLDKSNKLGRLKVLLSFMRRIESLTEFIFGDKVILK